MLSFLFKIQTSNPRANTTKSPLTMRGDINMAISHLSDMCLPKLAPLERLPKRQRVGPSASLDE